MARSGRPVEKHNYQETATGLDQGSRLTNEERARVETRRLEKMMDVNMSDLVDVSTGSVRPPESVPRHYWDCVSEFNVSSTGAIRLKLIPRSQLLNAWVTLTGRRNLREVQDTPTINFNVKGDGPS